jgi:hypothetical protein
MKKELTILALAFAFLPGCSQTTLRSEWKDPGYTGPGVRSVVVLCLPSDTKEKECEDEFVRQLQKAGISAAPGYSTTAEASVSKESALAKAREMGISRVLVSRFLQYRSQLDVYPENNSMMLMPDYDMWSTHRFVENQYQVFGTVLYDSLNGKTIWSAVSDTVLQSSEKKSVESYVRAMIKKLERQQLLSP